MSKCYFFQLFTVQIVLLVFVLVGFNCVLAISFKDIKMYRNYHFFYFCCWILWRRFLRNPSLFPVCHDKQKKKNEIHQLTHQLSSIWRHVPPRMHAGLVATGSWRHQTTARHQILCHSLFFYAPPPPSTRQPRLLPDQLGERGRAGAGVASGRCHGHTVKLAGWATRSGNASRKLTGSWENKALQAVKGCTVGRSALSA